MNYRYKMEEKALQKRFGGLLRIEESDTYELVYDEKSDTGLRRVENTHVPLHRFSQDTYKIHDVYIKDIQDVVILLDYLSTDHRNWDYEPKIRVHFPSKEIHHDVTIDFHRRGNYGHINNLENGDVLIIDDTLRKMVAEYMDIRIERNNAERAKRLEKENEELKARLKAVEVADMDKLAQENKEMRQIITNIRNTVSATGNNNLPF